MQGQPSKSSQHEESEEIELVSLESLEFPRDSPSFWNTVGQQDRWAANFIKDLEEQLKTFGDDFKTINTSHFDDYHKFIARNSAAYEVVPGLEELNKALKQLNELRMKLTTSFQKWESLTKKGIEELKDFQAKEEKLLTQRSAYLTKLKTYLTTKLKKVEKGQEKDKKMRVRKQDLALSRVDTLCHFQRIQIQKEVLVLAPMVECLNAYAEFFKSGNALLTPLQGNIAKLGEYVKKKAEDITVEEKKLASLRTDWEKQVAAEAQVDLSLYVGSSGIRDLDAIRDGGKKIETRKKEGYLFVQQPHFQRVWCSVDGENFTVHHSMVGDEDIAEGFLEGLLASKKKKGDPTKGDIVFPLQLCTVKETPDDKLRFAFQVISPSTKVPLQADSMEEMKEWIQVIQNGILFGLSGKKDPKDSKSPTPLGQRDAPSGAAGALGSPLPPVDAEDEDQKAIAQQIKELREVKGNDSCADCSTKNPEWISLNLGIMICVTCSGIHRSLGVHISKVRSCVLDKLDRFALATLKTVGNDNALDVWESKLQGSDKLKKSHKPNKSSKNWIQAKYEKKSFVGDAKEDPTYEPQRALFQAIEQQQPLEVLKAIARGGEVNKPNPDQENRTSIHHAVMYGDSRCVDIIALNGAELTHQESRGWTPLHYAAYQDDPDLCELLLLRGGSKLATTQSVDHQTPLETSRAYCESGEPKCSVVLERALAQVAAKQAAEASREQAALARSSA